MKRNPQVHRRPVDRDARRAYCHCQPLPLRCPPRVAQKNFILDTNVLLHDPNAIYGLGDNNVVIPIYCIEEVDNFKRDLSELGRNARTVSRHLDAFRAKGSLAAGIDMDTGGQLRVLFTQRQIPSELQNSHLIDNRILAVALDVRDSEPDKKAIFVTKDTNLRIRADALGMPAEDFDTERVELSELYSGVRELTVPKEQVDLYYQSGELEPADSNGFAPNEYVLLKDESNPSHTALGKYSPSKLRVVPVTKVPKE